MRLLRAVFICLMFRSPITRHYEDRPRSGGICDVDVEVSIANDVRVREINSELLLRTYQHSRPRLSTIASSLGLMRAKIDCIQFCVVPGKFDVKDIVDFVN